MQLDDLIVYHGGEFKPYPDAKLGLLTHAFNYGTGCFEGVRAFWSEQDGELYVFEPTAHYRRLAASAKLMLMDLPFAPDQLGEITAELCRRNGFRSDVYIRPVLYKSEETFGVRLDDLQHDLSIVAFPNSKYLDSNEGVKACVSTWRRLDDNAEPARAKITGSYVNSALAKSEARLNGFDEAIMLTDDGHVSESSAANLFVVRDGTVSTPAAAHNLLEGITRRIVAQIIARELGVPVVERAIDRTELYSADEVLICGTGVGIAWLRSLDHRIIGTGAAGTLATTVARVYDDVTRGRNTRFNCELRPVHGAPALVAT
ncbi:MAG TPA: branched-chain amino acid transaminase [Candidatus Elarobacter sp.]|jgi:branched-chain amino acid aminotransferase|nr:branched-chain amino acid transaminase [Candidatus Elarobacter sp.]